MAGTLPHAVFVETDLDSGCAAYAAELPGCATFAAVDEEAVRAMPSRAARFTAWLRDHGERTPDLPGDNWYEVERAAARDGGRVRAAFSLDELAPSPDEWRQWLGWMELAREELADVIEGREQDAGLEAITAQDLALAAALGGAAPSRSDDPLERLYLARDALTDALAAAGPTADGVRRAIRLAIADDLRAAERLRGMRT